jgi:hypothetical protein
MFFISGVIICSQWQRPPVMDGTASQPMDPVKVTAWPSDHVDETDNRGK